MEEFIGGFNKIKENHYPKRKMSGLVEGSKKTQFKKGEKHMGWNGLTKAQKFDMKLKEEVWAEKQGMPAIDYRQIDGYKPICLYCHETINPVLTVYSDGTLGIECGNIDCTKPEVDRYNV